MQTIFFENARNGFRLLCHGSRGLYPHTHCIPFPQIYFHKTKIRSRLGRNSEEILKVSRLMEAFCGRTAHQTRLNWPLKYFTFHFGTFRIRIVVYCFNLSIIYFRFIYRYQLLAGRMPYKFWPGKIPHNCWSGTFSVQFEFRKNCKNRQNWKDGKITSNSDTLIDTYYVVNF